jgi:hypothetical protein
MQTMRGDIKMEGFYIDPESQTVQHITLQQSIDKGLLDMRQTIQLILKVDIVCKMWYNESYNLYYQDQQELSKHKKLHWFKVEVENKEKFISGDAILVPSYLEETLDLDNTITWVADYTPPLQDFIL